VTILQWFDMAGFMQNLKINGIRVFDRNLKCLKYLTKLKLFDCQIFQILPILELEKKLETFNLTIFET